MVNTGSPQDSPAAPQLPMDDAFRVLSGLPTPEKAAPKPEAAPAATKGIQEPHVITTKGIEAPLLRQLLVEALELYPEGRSRVEVHRKHVCDALTVAGMRAALVDLEQDSSEVEGLLEGTKASDRARPLDFDKETSAAYDATDVPGRTTCEKGEHIHKSVAKLFAATRAILSRISRKSHSQTLQNALEAFISIAQVVNDENSDIQQIFQNDFVEGSGGLREAIETVLLVMDDQERAAALASLVDANAGLQEYGLEYIEELMRVYWTPEQIKKPKAPTPEKKRPIEKVESQPVHSNKTKMRRSIKARR